MKKGFTLLEVLIAMTILVGGIIVMTTSWSGSFMRVKKTNLYNNAALLLERKVIEIRSEYQTKSIEEVVDQEGDFGSEMPLYRWTFKTHDFQMPDLTAVLIGKEGGVDDTFLQMIKQTTEFISKSIKEGTVTIYVKSGAKELPFSVTTYFIDYNKELPLPGGLPSPPATGGGSPPSNENPSGDGAKKTSGGP